MDLYAQMKSACDQIGVKMLSDHTCCRLLALVLVYGDESAVYSRQMRRDIAEAAKRCNVGPGLIPDSRMVSDISNYVDQLEHSQAHGWLPQIEERYSVRFPAVDDWRKDAREHWKEYLHGGVRVSESEHRETGQR